MHSWETQGLTPSKVVQRRHWSFLSFLKPKMPGEQEEPQVWNEGDTKCKALKITGMKEPGRHQRCSITWQVPNKMPTAKQIQLYHSGSQGSEEDALMPPPHGKWHWNYPKLDLLLQEEKNDFSPKRGVNMEKTKSQTGNYKLMLKIQMRVQ